MANKLTDLLKKAGSDKKDKARKQDPKAEFKWDASRGHSPNFMRRKKKDEKKGPSREKLGVSKRRR